MTWPSTYFISETKRICFADLAADLQLDRRALLDSPVSATAEVEEDVPKDGVPAALDSYATVMTLIIVQQPNSSSDGLDELAEGVELDLDIQHVHLHGPATSASTTGDTP